MVAGCHEAPTGHGGQPRQVGVHSVHRCGADGTITEVDSVRP
jgi:hypothetical protein